MTRRLPNIDRRMRIQVTELRPSGPAGTLNRATLMHVDKRLVGALALLFAGGCRAQTLPVATPSEWSAPIDLPQMPPNRLHRWPIMTAVHDTIYVAANIYPINGTDVGARPIYLARIPGGPLPAPPGDFQFVYPKIAAAKNGEVHLIWAEFDSTQQSISSWGSAPMTTLWHSVFANARWSVPRQVLDADWIEWPRGGGNVAVDAVGRVHMVAWTVSDSIAGMVHLIGSSAGWRANRTPAKGRSQAAIEAFADSIVIAFVEASFDPSDTTGVTLALSPNGGTEWTATAVIQRLGGRQASSLHFIRRGASLYLAWAESPPRQFGRDTLRIVRLDNRLRPAPVAAVALPPGASTVAVTEACGSLAFLVETFSLRPRTFVGTINHTGEASLNSLRPPSEISAFAGIGSALRSVAVVLAIQPDPAAPARAVLVSRTACSTVRSP